LNEKRDATDFGKEIIPESIGKYTIASYQYEGYWEDIGNIRAFYEANLALTEDIPSFNLFDNKRAIFTRPRMLPPAKIGNTTLENSVIAEGSIINASRIIRSVVGIRSRIGHDTIINSSYIMGNDSYETLAQIQQVLETGSTLLGIGSRCLIQNAIIDKDCRIGDDVKIVGGTHLEDTDHSLYSIKEGIIVIKKGAVIPNGFELGVQ
jgi:glucose-1-phosphate adenylyltransferase